MTTVIKVNGHTALCKCNECVSGVVPDCVTEIVGCTWCRSWKEGVACQKGYTKTSMRWAGIVPRCYIRRESLLLIGKQVKVEVREESEKSMATTIVKVEPGVSMIKCGGCRSWKKGETCLRGYYKLKVWNDKTKLDERGYPDCWIEAVTMTSYCSGCREDKTGTQCKLGYIKKIVELNQNEQNCWKASVVGNVEVVKPATNTPEIVKVGSVNTMKACMWRACKRWKQGEACIRKSITSREFRGSCANFEFTGIRRRNDWLDSLATPRTPSTTPAKVEVVEDVRAIEGAKIAMPDGSTSFFREDMTIWCKPRTYGSKAFVWAKIPDLLLSLGGSTARLKIEPELLREPTEEWRLPVKILTKWAAMMLETTKTEMSCLYGKRMKPKKGEPLWLAVVPKQECTAGSVDVDDQGKAVALLAKRGYRMVGSIHTHPGAMTSCSGTDTGEHWKHAGGIHIIVTRVGTTGTYFAVGGTTWTLRGKIWNYGALWKDPEVYQKYLKEWQAEGTLLTEGGAKKVKAMVSTPFIRTTYVKPKHTQNSQRDLVDTQNRYMRKVVANEQVSARGKVTPGGTSYSGHSCFICARFKGKKKNCTEFMKPKTWHCDGLANGCGFFEAKGIKKNCLTCTYYNPARGPVFCELDKLADANKGCKDWEAPREKKKISTLREALMVMVDESKTYTDEQKEWLGDRIDEWNGVTSFFHDMLTEIEYMAPQDRNLDNLGPQVEEIEKRLKVLAIVMAGQDLETEDEYAIERGLVGDPDEDTKEPLFV